MAHRVWDQVVTLSVGFMERLRKDYCLASLQNQRTGLVT
ncbi:hypothetical protein SAMN05216222_5396 [Pseudomonas prosekii]|uniref:Uncharacterized protein n=1 Tax=Pseudomonas prosekii TaxID=1148509 RepID=A0A1H2BQX2_9PSED|nr:hypothetical protein SAMN05216222_5396 [Pseudomonas prosekii]